MACCGRGKKSPVPPPVQRETPPALPSVPPPKPAPPPKQIVRNIPKPAPKKEEPPKPVPTAIAPENELPPCRFREFKSKQTIGGREIENYFCQAFLINVRKEHCRVCQKHDK
jgi:hypothetical protein